MHRPSEQRLMSLMESSDLHFWLGEIVLVVSSTMCSINLTCLLHVMCAQMLYQTQQWHARAFHIWLWVPALEAHSSVSI